MSAPAAPCQSFSGPPCPVPAAAAPLRELSGGWAEIPRRGGDACPNAVAESRADALLEAHGSLHADWPRVAS